MAKYAIINLIMSFGVRLGSIAKYWLDDRIMDQGVMINGKRWLTGSEDFA